MKIALDVMGGDEGLETNISGAIKSLDIIDGKVILVGKKESIEAELERYTYNKSRIDIIDAKETISNEEEPAMAIRKKKDSSIVVGMNSLKDGQVDAFVSSGNTGALLSGGLLIVKRIKGIDRPALGSVYPTRRGISFLLDIGANSDCKPKYLQQFAVMGDIYSKEIIGVSSPKVGIVNIGVEREKGNELTKEAYGLLESVKNINFIGNIEARDVPRGDYDVLVCDGFTGNIIIKLSEGLAMSMFSMLKEKFKNSFKGKLGALMLRGGLTDLKKSLDYTEYGGAMLLGVKAPIIKAHGSSNDIAIMNAIRQAGMAVDNDIVDNIEKNIGLLGGQDV